MDVKCHKCGEPWAIDHFHDVAQEQGTSFRKVREAFYLKGCEAVGARHSDTSYRNDDAVSALQDILGDDIDGLAAMIEDFGL